MCYYRYMLGMWNHNIGNCLGSSSIFAIWEASGTLRESSASLSYGALPLMGPPLRLQKHHCGVRFVWGSRFVSFLDEQQQPQDYAKTVAVRGSSPQKINLIPNAGPGSNVLGMWATLMAPLRLRKTPAPLEI